MTNLKLCAGEWVEVRSKEEILHTLDKRGQLDNLPFMPQMFQCCGKRFRVYKRAHKTCDTVNDYKGRKMRGGVHLEGVRCDGQAYAGCDAACLIFWKEDWLRRVGGPVLPSGSMPGSEMAAGRDAARVAGCTEADVVAGTRAAAAQDGPEMTYLCQATQVPAATEPLAWWNVKQYSEDYFSGNVTLGRMFRGFAYMGYSFLMNSGIGLGSGLRWVYDWWQGLTGGVPYPRRQGQIPAGARTPAGKLDLQPGEWVRVKSYKDILATLNPENRNRGLFFDAEMVPYCGGTYRVLKRVSRIVNEKNGRLQEMKTPCLILEGVVCGAQYSECRLFCPRAIYSYWRESWLERVPPPAAAPRTASDQALASPRA
jgi:hypothetical protein